MQTIPNLKPIWEDLAKMLAELPLDEQARYLSAIGTLLHDLRQNIATIYTAEGLLRRSISESAETSDLLDIIRTSSQRAIGLVTDLAQPFDRAITLPLNRPLTPQSTEK